MNIVLNMYLADVTAIRSTSEQAPWNAQFSKHLLQAPGDPDNKNILQYKHWKKSLEMFTKKVDKLPLFK